MKSSLSRSVSIVGVGCTRMGTLTKSPWLAGLTESELFAWASLEAMKDAGLEGKDIDILFHGQIGNVSFSRLLNPAAAYQDWVGMHGKPCIHHEEACGTGYVGFNLAVMAVASGACDIALTGGVEVLSTVADARKPAHMREEASHAFKIGEIADILADPTYSRFPSNIIHNSLFEYPPTDYMERYGITLEQFDDMCNALAIQARRASSRHPLAFYQTELETIAREAGYDDAMEYLRQDAYNRKTSKYYRKLHSFATTDGAAAVIVCTTEIAKKLKQQPIEVLGISGASMDTRHPRNEEKITEISIQQVYEKAGVKPEEIDLFQTQDLEIFDQIDSAEIAGYLPKGEGWQAALDGCTGFDGERPINTNGGRTGFGHAYAASGLADVGEVVQQMRGQCGARQVKKLPETALLRGIGGGQNATAAILRTVQ